MTCETSPAYEEALRCVRYAYECIPLDKLIDAENALDRLDILKRTYLRPDEVDLIEQEAAILAERTAT